ncbi:hypothetical protein HK104_005371, partial [Borealophlyctis nickersoniae]
MAKLLGTIKERGSIFVLGQARESAIERLKQVALTPAQMLDQLGYIFEIAGKALGELDEMTTILVDRLKRQEFGSRNVALKTNDLERFVSNATVFQWFADEHKEVASKMVEGLKETRTPPKSDDERIRELEEHNRQVEEQNRQLLALLNNQQNEPKRIAYERPLHKRPQITGPGGEESDGRDDNRTESSEGEESHGRDHKRAEDALDDEIKRLHSEEMVEKEGKDTEGGEASAATNNVEVVLKDREIDEEKLKTLVKMVKRKLKDAKDVEEKTRLEGKLARAERIHGK